MIALMMRIWKNNEKPSRLKEGGIILPLLLLLSIFFGQSEKAKAQWQIMDPRMDSLVTLGADYIYNVEFDAAEKTFNQVIDLYPNHPGGHFLKSMIYWWNMQLVGMRPNLEKKFLEEIDNVLEVTDAILDTNEYDLNGLFFKGGALGYRGRYYGQKKEWYKAATDGTDALDIMEKAYKVAPTNYDIMLGKGVYNYFADAIPEKYPVAKPLLAFFPPGDKNIGLMQLKLASDKARYADIESMVLLMQVYYGFENNYNDAYFWANKLFTLYPGNGYFHKYIARIYVKQGNWTKIEDEWRKILIMALDRKPGYDNMMAREACYYVGRSLFRKGNYDTALRYFAKVDEVSDYMDEEDSSYASSALIYMGQIYMRKDKKKEARKKFQEVLEIEEWNNSHDTARKYLKKL
ncbi:MAG: hypothetical protein Kapaf2KO_12340 [Candidatus Kapaibacteriales bacterium]